MKLPPLNTVFIDKLGLSFHRLDVTERQRRAITGVLEDFCSNGRATRLAGAKKGFVNRFRVPIKEKDGLFVEINPRSPDQTVWHMKLEFNPARYFGADKDLFTNTLKEILGTDHRLLLDGASVNVVDLTVDHRVSLSDVAIECREKNACGAWGKSFDSGVRLQTLYFGTRKTDHQIAAYDKRDELLAEFAKSKPGVTLKAVSDKAAKLRPRLRVEAHCKFSRRPVPLHRLADIRDPFKGTHIYEYRNAEAVVTSTVGKLALELAKVSGLQVALKHVSKAERETLRKQLSGAAAEWWDAAEYAKQVVAAFQNTGLFSQSAFEWKHGKSKMSEHEYQLSAAKAKANAGGKVDKSKFPDLENEGDDD
ncbi:MAG: hypothetical protein IPP44_25020 [Ideonella sp.]|nr:hypothetical protein [Ideonella sp.]